MKDNLKMVLGKDLALTTIMTYQFILENFSITSDKVKEFCSIITNKSMKGNGRRIESVGKVSIAILMGATMKEILKMEIEMDKESFFMIKIREYLEFGFKEN